MIKCNIYDLQKAVNKRYASEIKKDVPDSILSFMADIIKVLDFIVERKEQLAIAA